ncbi:ABC transporter permease [Tetragenococcus halophilus subsp. flandriensis]|uniref:FtsX-like permease family protein n=1 Tax=Tetragenococcus halophilus TaxID=51669 RepID=UPI0023EA2FFA|nr:ABC transporter permease [Tetragenococcus halophilus]GMA08106.1 ABC transporter permease [Tetragenococcus halophilus subsp. flandriensis]
MHNGFYAKLALQSIRENSRLYYPFIISSIVSVMMTFIILSLSVNSGLKQIPGGANLQTILALGYVVLVLFSAIFLFYMNSFLMKNRKKEFGIYNILGMDKKHISRILTYEMLFIYFVSLIVGLIAGMLLNKVATLLIRRMLAAPVSLGFELSIPPILWTLGFFFLIFLAVLLVNIYQIRLANPIELLKASNTGEKEPKIKILWTTIGFLLLGVGYYLALTIQSPILGMQLVFLAILIVIAATYLLFTTGTITFLKLLKKNKNYYYQTKHFIPISGMLYRMKKNAVGLANISILSVGVVLMFSIAASLYLSTDNSVNTQYPRDVISEVKVGNSDSETEDTTKARIQEAVEQLSINTDIQVEDLLSYTYLNFPAQRDKNGFTVTQDVYSTQTNQTPANLYFVDQENYQEISGNQLDLAENEVIVHGTVQDYTADTLSILNQQFEVREENNIEEFAIGNETSNAVNDGYYIIVSSPEVLQEIDKSQQSVLQEKTTPTSVFSQFDLVNARKQEKIDFSDHYEDKLQEEKMDITNVDTRVEANGNFRALRGGVLFLVLNLALLLLMMTVLIIYYKQISEAYDDKERFRIMRNVGLSDAEIKQAIRSQMLSVFFLPVFVTGIHTLVMLPLMKKGMVLVMLNQVNLFPLSLFLAFVIFLLVYIMIYRITAKTYYKIVK